MNINGKYYKDSYINRLLQIQRFRLSLSDLLDKPDSYYEALKKRPKAVDKLKCLLLSPFPTSFVIVSRELDFFRNRATTEQKTNIIEHRENVINIIFKLIDKIEIKLTENERKITDFYRSKT